MSIGENIKKARKAAGLTQKELGEKLGVSNTMIAIYETGRRMPKTDTLQRIASALNCSVASLFPAITDFKAEIADRIKTYNDALNETDDEIERTKLKYKINLLENEEWGVVLSGQTDEIYTISTYFMDILDPYIKLNSLGKAEAAKRVEELTHIDRYKFHKKDDDE